MPDEQPSPWPDELELLSHLEAAGLISQPLPPALAAVDWQGIVDSYIAEFEAAVKRVCGAYPFLATPAGTVREWGTPDLASRVSDPYGAPVRILPLPGGVLEVSEVRLFTPSEFGAVDTSGEGRLLQAGADYRLFPVGARSRDLPYTEILFSTPGLSAAFSSGAGASGVVRITGRFGYTLAVPPEVRRAVFLASVAEAAALCQSAAFVASGGLAGVKQTVKIGPVEETTSAGGAAANSVLLYGDPAQREAALQRLYKLARRYKVTVMA